MLANGLLLVGGAGFCISVFGAVASLFLLLTSVASLIIVWTLYSYVRRVGLLFFLPQKVTHLLLHVSIFDILVNIFIYRRFSKMMTALFSPFFQAKTPEEAKHILKDQGKLSPAVYKAVFRKGVLNNFSVKVQSIMYPEDTKTLPALLEVPQLRVKRSQSFKKEHSSKKVTIPRVRSRSFESNVRKEDKAFTPKHNEKSAFFKLAVTPCKEEGQKSTTGSAPQVTSTSSDEAKHDQKLARTKQVPRELTQKLRSVHSEQDFTLKLLSRRSTMIPKETLLIEAHGNLLKEQESMKSDSGFIVDSEGAVTEMSAITYEQKSPNLALKISPAIGFVSETSISPMSLAMLALKDPKALVERIAKGSILSLFRKGLKFQQLLKLLLFFSALFLLQLKFSVRSRQWAKSILHGLLFGATFSGLVVLFVLMSIKYKLHVSTLKQISEQVQEKIHDLQVQAYRPTPKSHVPAPVVDSFFLEDC